MQGTLDEVARRQAADPSVFVPQQFINPDNPAIHHQTTAPEIWAQMDGRVDGFIPPVLNPSIVDEVVEVSDCDAIETSRMLARKQGLLVGISSGANVWAAMQVARKGACGLRIATILPDRAERYFSCDLI